MNEDKFCLELNSSEALNEQNTSVGVMIFSNVTQGLGQEDVEHQSG